MLCGYIILGIFFIGLHELMINHAIMRLIVKNL